MEILGLPEPDPQERRAQDASVIGGSLARRRPGPDRRALIGSVAFHLALVLGLFATTVIQREEPEFEVYRVKLFSPPPQQEAPAPEPVALNTRIQAPRTAEAPPVRPPTEPPRPTPRPQTVEKPPEDKPPPKAAEPVKGPDAKPDSPGGENIDVNFEGRDFPYPEYLENIILQLNRHFRWSGAPNLESQVMFYVNRDGSVGGIRVLQKSGDFNFDLQSMSAVEQAGRRGAFGPLPDGWAQDRLWVRFRFLPPG